MAEQTARIVQFHELGSANVLKLETVPLPEPGPGEVRLRVKAIGLNRAEVVFRKGQYLVQPKLPSKLGYEASGIVEAVGTGVDPNLVGKVRSTVPAFAADRYGVYGEVAIVPASALAAYPEALSFEEGTAIWMQYFTAWGALIYYGGLKAGEFCLITAGSSSVGIAAVQVAKAQGAVAIVTTRTAAKKEELLGFGADHVIVTDDEDLAARVDKITGGKGARVVFDPVAGPGLEALCQAASPQGILFIYGALARDPTPFPLFSILSKHLTIRGYTLFEIMAMPEVRAAGDQYIFDKLKAGAFRPVIDKRRFTLDQIVEAQRYMESNAQVGKIVVTV